MTYDEKPTRSHKDLPVWQQAIALAECVFRLCDDLAEDDQHGLAPLLRHAAVKAPSSIAEGAARSSTGELGHFLGIALGAIAEVETLLELATRLDLADHTDDATALLENVRKQLIVYRRSLRS